MASDIDELRERISAHRLDLLEQRKALQKSRRILAVVGTFYFPAALALWGWGMSISVAVGSFFVSYIFAELFMLVSVIICIRQYRILKKIEQYEQDLFEFELQNADFMNRVLMLEGIQCMQSYMDTFFDKLKG